MQEKSGSDRFRLAGVFTVRNFAISIALLLAIAYYPVLLGGETFCYRDFGVMGIPTAAYHRAALWAGELPLWNPYSNCGVPFLAQWGTMVLYPPTLLYVLLPMPWSLNFFCLGHLWLGALGMFLLARRWKLEAGPCALAGAGFTFCGLTQSSLSWPNYTAALGLLPWVLLTAEKAWDGSTVRCRGTFVAMMVSSLQLLTGVPELAVFTWVIALLFWGERWFSQAARRAHLFWALLLVILGSALVCAAQLLPFFQLLQHSQRTPGFAAEKWALPPWGWANFLLPRFHTFTTPEGTVFQYGQEFFSSVYLGAPLLLLALLAFGVRDRRVLLLGLLSAFAAVLALGSQGYLYTFAGTVAPLLKIARYPVKFLCMLSFTIPFLAAYGLQRFGAEKNPVSGRALTRTALILLALMAGLIWWNQAHPFRYDRVGEIRANSLVRVLMFVAAAGGLFWLRSGKANFTAALQAGLLLLICLDGRTHLERQNPTVGSAIFEPGLWAQAQKISKPEHGTGRAFITPAGEARLLHSSVPDVREDLVGKRLAVWSHLNLLDLVPKVNGSATLQMKDQAMVQNALYASTNVVSEPWLDFLNVTIMTSSNSVIEWQPRTGPMPFITAGQRPVRANTNLLDHPLSFGREVAIEPWFSDLEQLTNSLVEISEVSVQSGEISFAALADKPAVAVLPVSWHPAWMAEVSLENGQTKRLPVLKANLAFQAIPIPAGRSHVRVVYHDRAWVAGLWISGLALAGLGVFCLAKQKRPSQI